MRNRVDGACARLGPEDRSWAGLGGPVSKAAVCGARGGAHQLCIDRPASAPAQKNTHKCPKSIDIDRQLSRELGTLSRGETCSEGGN